MRRFRWSRPDSDFVVAKNAEGMYGVVSHGDPVPAIAESEAVGSVADVFDDIRRGLGTSSVNLIWRHLATIPGALGWCWDAVSPVLYSGELPQAGRAYRTNLQVLEVPEVPSCVLETSGLSSVDVERIRSTLTGYLVSCSINILSLNALLVVLDGRALGVSILEKQSASLVASPMQRMAKLLDPSAMSDSVARMAWEMNSLGETGDGRILASQYRYLANWPQFMPLAWALIRPLHDSGRLQEAAVKALTAADSVADAIAPELYTGGPPLEDAIIAEVRPALQDFARNAIPKVMPITAALLAALDGPLSERSGA